MGLFVRALPQLRLRCGASIVRGHLGLTHRYFSSPGRVMEAAIMNPTSENVQHQPAPMPPFLQGSHELYSPYKQVDQDLRNGTTLTDFGFAEQQLSQNPIRLREACTCHHCVDPTDHQRHFVFADIPSDIDIATHAVDVNGNHSVTWRNDIPGYSQHESHYTRAEMEQINQQHTIPVAKLGRRSKRVWEASTFHMADNTVSYKDYMNDDTALARVLHLISRDGLAFISEIPSDESSVNKMAERVGPLRTTFYGETWDVKSMPDATNVAYTSRYLGFHMDMLYVREPPGLQFLHCLENTCDGGESRFADTFGAADRLVSQQNGSAAFDALRSLNITYHYRRPGIYTSAVKPVFDTTGRESKPPHNFTNAARPDLINQLHRVYWSPPFTGRAMGGDDFSRSQLDASKAFHDILEHESSVIETKVPAGTCAVFDNFRVVHARRAFDLNSGRRWLRVAYVDDSDFQSRAVTTVDLMPSEELVG